MSACRLRGNFDLIKADELVDNVFQFGSLAVD